MTQLSRPNFLGFINGYTKETKELIDNSVELNNDRQAYAFIVDSTDTTEINEKFVSTVRDSNPQKTAEGQKVGASDSYTGFETVVTPLDKTTDSTEWSFEYYQGKRDWSQRIEQEFDRDVKSKMWGMYNEVNGEVYSLINEGFTTTLSPDREVLYSAAHKFTDDLPGKTFDNLMPAVAPSTDVLADLQERSGEFVDVGDRPMSLNPRKLVVKRGGKAFREFHKIIQPERYQPVNISGANNGVNIYEGEYQMVETPYVATSTEYHFMEDYSNSVLSHPLYLGFHQRPTIYGQDEYIDSLTYKTVYVSYYKRAVKNIPIGMYGSVGA
ncbi:MAG: hypothetical protein GY861_10275 [bacterium]|nr:hypothetical protein [bacterium]